MHGVRDAARSARTLHVLEAECENLVHRVCPGQDVSGHNDHGFSFMPPRARSLRRSRTARRGSPRRARRPFPPAASISREELVDVARAALAFEQARGAVRLPALGFVFGAGCRESCGRGSGTAALPAADRRSRCAAARALPATGCAAASSRRRSSLPTKPPYRSSSTSGAASRGRSYTCAPDRAHVGQGGAPARRCASPRSRSMPQRAAMAGAERLQVADHHRRLVQVHALDRQPRARLRAGRRCA